MMANPFRVLVAGKVHPAGIKLLQQQQDLVIDLIEPVAAEAYRPHLPEADALLLRTQPLTAADIASAPRLKIVSRHGVGYDAVDIAALNARNIPLAIVGDVNSRAVAEHTLMLLLTAARRSVAHHLAATTGRWNERNDFNAVELDGKTLLVLGFGRIGRRVATLAKAFGMDVLAHDPLVPAEALAEHGVAPAPDLIAALPRADFVTLHLPGGKSPILGETELQHMKPTAIVVNAARGGLIDEAALDAALRARHLRAAALDVLVEEPPAPTNPLLSNPFLTLSPHNAGLTEECAMRMALAAAQNILDAREGRLDPKLVVNFAALKPNR